MATETNPSRCSLFTTGILLSFFLIMSASLAKKTDALDHGVVQERDNGISPMAQSYTSSCNVPDLPCFCNGPNEESGDQTVYSSIQCFLSGEWNTTIANIPLTRSLLLSCIHRGNGTVEPVDLTEDLFDKFAGVLQELKMRCKIGSLPTEIFTDLVHLQSLLIVSADLNPHRLSAIGAIQTNVSVKLSLNDLQSLNANSFGNRISNVSTLDLSYNGVQDIGNGTFAMFPYLRKLFLGNNNISYVEEDAFSGLQRLSELSIRVNPNVFSESWCLLKSVPSLTILDLSFTGLTNVTQFNCFSLVHLRKLLINDNSLPELGDSVFAPMPNIDFIDVSNNDVEYVHSGAFHGGLVNLKHVNMSGNRLRNFPAFAFEATPRITSIDISHNNLSVIKGGTFSGLPSLQTIDLSFNRLQTIEMFAFVKLDNLTMIDLRHNNFVTFPDDLVWPFDILPPHIPMKALFEGNHFTCGCPYMFFIRKGNFEDTYPFFFLPDNSTWTCLAPPPVANKPMMTLPLEDFWCPYEDQTCRRGSCECYKRDVDKANIFFCRNHTLHSLPNFPAETLIFDCNGCLIDDQVILQTGVLPGSDKLVVLVLRDIGLETILSPALQEFPSLQELDVSHNALKAVGDDILTNLTHLRTIDLSSNSINTLSSYVFETNINLNSIFIQSNSLETLEDGVFNSTTNLKVVTLHDNPFICNCSLFWLKQWLQSHLDVVPHMYDVTCYVNSSDAEAYPIIQVADQDFGCYTPDIHTLTVQEYNAVIITSTITVLFLMVGAVMFRHRRAIRVILYTRYGFHVLHDDDDDVALDDMRWEYDAYIAYGEEDMEFVLQNILPMLEEGDNPWYKLCIRHRDFPPGGCIATTIVTTVEASRRTIVLLSRNFLQDEWRLLEFKTAHQRVLQDKRNKNLILVFLEDLEKDEMDEDMRYYVTANAYMSTRDRLFRENLLYEMPRYPLAEIHGHVEHER